MTSRRTTSAHCPSIEAGVSRRALFARAGASALSLAIGLSGLRRDALAAPIVTVAAPTIRRTESCLAVVTVQVAVSERVSGVRFRVSGDILEADGPDGAPEICCQLEPRTTSGNQGSTVLTLGGPTSTAELGMVKGLGPARDETFSPDLVELFARIWLVDVRTGERYGPWESPLRIVVASEARAWNARRFPGSELLTPRGNGSGREHQTQQQPRPPLECAD